ncbi:MAG: hypothetical protein J7L98_05115 [Candidatus Verstraetearchaeota archaeon]|nr:hypothetical protein [Candidatus Verstraetearchaeota archaeon]
MVKIYIEHCEPALSKWLWLEYRHASKLAGRENIAFCNVKDERERRLLEKLGEVYEESVTELPLDRARTVILDPEAVLPLTPSDFKIFSNMVVGGILGDHPPQGRTFKLISSKMRGVSTRNLGRRQLSIDSSVYMALRVAEDIPLSGIPMKRRLIIKVNEHHSIMLPYTYPLVEGKPLVAPGLIKYLKDEIVKDEEAILRTGKPVSIADKLESHL